MTELLADADNDLPKRERQLEQNLVERESALTRKTVVYARPLAARPAATMKPSQQH